MSYTQTLVVLARLQLEPVFRSQFLADPAAALLSWDLGPAHPGSHSEVFRYPIEQLRAALAAPGWPEATPMPTRLVFRKVPGLPAVLVRAG